MSNVTNTTIISRTVLNVKSVLESEVGSTIIDPKSSTRPSSKPFVRVTRAVREVYYPHVLVEAWLVAGDVLSLQGDQLRALVQVQVSVFTKNMKDLDEIMSQVLEVMRSKRDTFKAYGLHRSRTYLQNISPVLTDSDNVHSRAAMYQFVYYMQ